MGLEKKREWKNNTLLVNLWHGLRQSTLFFSCLFDSTEPQDGVLEGDMNAVFVFSSRLEGFLSLTLKAGVSATIRSFELTGGM